MPDTRALPTAMPLTGSSMSPSTDASGELPARTWKRKLAKLSSGRLWEVLSVFVVRGLGAVSLFVLYFVAARRLTRDDAGDYFLGLTISTILAPISLFGMHTIALRELSARLSDTCRGERRYLIGFTLRRGALLALVPAVILFAFAPQLAAHVFHRPSLTGIFQYAAIAGYAGSLNTLISGQLQGLRRFSQSLLILSIATPLATSALLIAPLGPHSALRASQLYALASWLTVAVGLLCVYRLSPRTPATSVLIERLTNACFSLWIINAMIMAVNWSGQLIAGALLAPGDVALLAVSQRTANLVNFILIGVNFVVTPRFSAFWAERDMKGLQRLAIDSTRAMSLIAIPIVVVIACMPERIMSWFGSSFAGGGTLLLILAIGQLVNVMTGSVNALLNMCGFDRDLRNIVVLSGTLTIGLSWWMTRSYGVSGCAIAITTALILQNMLAVTMVKRRLGFSMFEALLPKSLARRFFCEFVKIDPSSVERQ